MPHPIMPIEQIPDWEQRLARQDAFWSRQIIDRPVACMHYPRPRPLCPPTPRPVYATLRDRWMDSETRARQALEHSLNTVYAGDALPGYFPNLGPEVFSAFFGIPMEYGETTSWSVPLLECWEDEGRFQFSKDNAYWKKIEEMTDAGLAIGRNHYYTGITDLHPGADAIAAFRDPMQLNIDLIESPAAVKRFLDRVMTVYFEVLTDYLDKLQAAGQAICCWPGIVSSKRWYVPSNDFSCMISSAMFDEFFLPGIVAECRAVDASIYHLDGPDALRHLDRLLAIPELNAIQWVYGAGHGRASDWIPVYKQCQAAGKGLQIHIHLDELPLLMETLRPEGLWLGIGGVDGEETAHAVLKRLTQWT